MERVLTAVAQVLYDKKARNILALDLRGHSTLTDYFLIAEGTVDRHVKALEAAVKEYLRSLGQVPLREEGLRVGDWVVMDYGDFMIHIFLPEMREKYALEEVWRQSELIDLHLDISKKEER